MKLNYYKMQLDKINKLCQIDIKVTDYNGNETIFMVLNSESIKEIRTFLDEAEPLLVEWLYPQKTIRIYN